MLWLFASAHALNPPPVDQSITEWEWFYDMGTPNDTSDDVGSSFLLDVSATMTVAEDCSVFEQPPNQPKSPEGCGQFTVNTGQTGVWLYYDGDAADAPPGGWGGKAFWRDRLIVRYNEYDAIWLGKYYSNPQSSACLTQTVCTTGVKFCGEARLKDEFDNEISSGRFDFCSAPL